MVVHWSETPLQKARRLNQPVRICTKTSPHGQHTHLRSTWVGDKRQTTTAWCPGRR